MMSQTVHLSWECISAARLFSKCLPKQGKKIFCVARLGNQSIFNKYAWGLHAEAVESNSSKSSPWSHWEIRTHFCHHFTAPILSSVTNIDGEEDVVHSLTWAADEMHTSII